jgi:hypothetical protein
MKKEDVIFERKEFLNLPGHNGMANVVASIVTNRWGKPETDDDGNLLRRNTEYQLDFADCDRKVSMDIDDDDEYSRENALYKVDTLIDVLTEFRDALEKELKYQHRLEKRRKRHKEKQEKEG